MQVIDIHNHFFPNSWPDLGARYGTPDWPWIKHTAPGKADIMVGDRFFRHIYSACWDPEVRLQEMDRDGIDLQVISATPVLFAYERPVEHALDCAQLFNDAALELCSRGKGRLKSFCQVPLQDTDAACKELSRCMRSGHLGVQIGNHVGDKNLDNPGIVTFLHHCADVGAAVLVHPWDMLGKDRMPKYMMPWTVGMPAETQLSVVALILSGAFDRLPKRCVYVLRMAVGVSRFYSGDWRMRGIIIRLREVTANIHPATISTASTPTPRCLTNTLCNFWWKRWERIR